MLHSSWPNTAMCPPFALRAAEAWPCCPDLHWALWTALRSFASCGGDAGQTLTNRILFKECRCRACKHQGCDKINVRNSRKRGILPIHNQYTAVQPVSQFLNRFNRDTACTAEAMYVYFGASKITAMEKKTEYFMYAEQTRQVDELFQIINKLEEGSWTDTSSDYCDIV